MPEKPSQALRPAGRQSQATLLASLALSDGVELFHTPGGDAFVTVTLDDHRETYALRSKRARSWLSALYFTEQEAAPGGQAVHTALGALEGKALYAGSERRVHVRIAQHQDAIYIDLGDAGWRAIRVARSGWDVVDEPPVRFWRPRGLARLPVPTPGGSINELRPFVNIQNDTGWLLYLGALVQALRPVGPYPVVVMFGVQAARSPRPCASSAS